MIYEKRPALNLYEIDPRTELVLNHDKLFTYFFAGVNCEVNIDECESNTCQNNATCVDGINNFTCSCQPGFTGRFCETNINECEVKHFTYYCCELTLTRDVIMRLFGGHAFFLGTDLCYG